MKAIQAYDQTAELKLRSKDAIIHFDEGLIGFSEFKDFLLVENDGLAPFTLLQSLESQHDGGNRSSLPTPVFRSGIR